MNLLARLLNKKPAKTTALVGEQLEEQVRQAFEAFYTCTAAIAFVNLVNLVDEQHRLKIKLFLYHDGQQVRMDLKWCIPGIGDVKFEGEGDYRDGIDRLIERWK